MGADLAIALLIGAGYTIAALSIGVGLIALVVWLFVLPRQAVQASREGWWADVALALLLLAVAAVLASWLTGCSVAVSCQHEAPPAAERTDSFPD